jgi:hypothetical protein
MPLPEIYESQIAKWGMDYDVQLGEAVEKWREHVDRVNSERLARGIIRQTDRLENAVLWFAAGFLALTVVLTLLKVWSV